MKKTNSSNLVDIKMSSNFLRIFVIS